MLDVEALLSDALSEGFPLANLSGTGQHADDPDPAVEYPTPTLFSEGTGRPMTHAVGLAVRKEGVSTP